MIPHVWRIRRDLTDEPTRTKGKAKGSGHLQGCIDPEEDRDAGLAGWSWSFVRELGIRHVELALQCDPDPGRMVIKVFRYLVKESIEVIELC